MNPRRLVGLSYLLGLLLVVFPLVDLAANLWPWDVGAVNWRYGSYGLLSGFTLTPFMGGILLLGTAVVAGHARTVRVLSIAAWLAGVLLVGATLLYGLDALQLRASVPAEAATPFAIGTLKALLKNGVIALVLGWTGWVGWRTARRASRAPAATAARPSKGSPILARSG